MVGLSSIRLWIVAVSFLPLASATADEPPRAAPEAYVRGIGDKIIGVLNASDTPRPERLGAIRKIFAAEIDFDLVSKFVLGRHWRNTAPKQRAEFRKVYKRYVTARYAGMLMNYGGETFAVVKSQTLSNRDALVETAIRTADGKAVKMDIRVSAESKKHAVIDVYIEGVSFLITNRKEFDPIIVRNGITALLEKLKGVPQ
jgi:phospholipid transport system substrate-binding protein